MQRVTISMSDEFAATVDAFMTLNGYDNRSEAVRDLARSGLAQRTTETIENGNCVAALSYIFNHHMRDLPNRLTAKAHEVHHLAVATLHVHLDHDNCLEISVLKGRVAEVKKFANAVVSERGVRHGNIHFIPANIETGMHRHGETEQPHTHVYPPE